MKVLMVTLLIVGALGCSHECPKCEKWQEQNARKDVQSSKGPGWFCSEYVWWSERERRWARGSFCYRGLDDCQSMVRKSPLGEPGLGKSLMKGSDDVHIQSPCYQTESVWCAPYPPELDMEPYSGHITREDCEKNRKDKCVLCS